LNGPPVRRNTRENFAVSAASIRYGAFA
jgi:hypothetical protein